VYPHEPIDDLVLELHVQSLGIKDRGCFQLVSCDLLLSVLRSGITFFLTDTFNYNMVVLHSDEEAEGIRQSNLQVEDGSHGLGNNEHESSPDLVVNEQTRRDPGGSSAEIGDAVE
jgi:hypothetical protein